MAEGTTLLREALAAGVIPETVFYAPHAATDLVAAAFDAGAAVYPLADGVMEQIADAVTPQPVCAVLPMVDVSLSDLPDDGVVVVAVDVRDPGNAGTMLRSAAAAGAAGVVFCNGSVELTNPKTVRSTAGALFKIPVVTSVSVDDALTALGARGRLRRPAPAELTYCAEVVAATYTAMGLLDGSRPTNYYDPGRFWSGDDLELLHGATLNEEIEVRP